MHKTTSLDLKNHALWSGRQLSQSRNNTMIQQQSSSSSSNRFIERRTLLLNVKPARMSVKIRWFHVQSHFAEIPLWCESFSSPAWSILNLIKPKPKATGVLKCMNVLFGSNPKRNPLALETHRVFSSWPNCTEWSFQGRQILWLVVDEFTFIKKKSG